ncbi:hypothetical protein ACFL4J_01140 [Candidatus Margulisiibacteriota bacterium]
MLFRFLAVSLALTLSASSAYAGNIALRAGFTTPNYDTNNGFSFNSGSDDTWVYDSNGSTPLPSGYAVECYWVGSNGVINDPGLGDDVLIGSVKYVGNDSDTWNDFSGTDGRFYHDYSKTGVTASYSSNIYFRIWDNAAVENPGALFGESNRVTANYDASIIPLPYNHGLTNTTVQFTQVAPAAPTLGTVTPQQATAGGSPSITINCSSAIHGRGYYFEVSSPEATGAGPFTFNSYKTATTYNSVHAADTSTGSTRSSGSITLNQEHDNTYVKVRVRALNDYGNSGWTESASAYYIPETPDPTLPVPITDLQASVEGTSVTLTWSAPYDTNKSAVEEPCVEYAIRVSTEAIVDDPVAPYTASYANTNPLSIETWSMAQSIDTYFASSPIIPTPLAYATEQTVTITGITLSDTYFFGIKGKDASGNWSYVSNIAGVQVGSAGGVESKTYTFSREAGGLGINTFTIPYSTPLVSPAITNLLELIQNINIQAGTNVVYTLGWWDAVTMQPAGYEIKYASSGTLNTIDSIVGTSGLGYPDTVSIEKDKVYQIYVIQDTSFTIQGQR